MTLPLPTDSRIRIKEQLLHQLAMLLSQLREMDSNDLSDLLRVSATLARVDKLLEMSNRLIGRWQERFWRWTERTP